MNESNQPKRKEKESEQEGVINIGDISSISGDMINLTSEDSAEVDVSQQIKTFDVEGSTYIEGSVHTGGGDFVGRDTIEFSATMEKIHKLFLDIQTVVDEKADTSPEDKDDLFQIIREIESEAAKGEETDENLLARQLRTLGKVAPDIFTVLLDTLDKPEAGVGKVTRSLVVEMKSKFTPGV